MFKTIFQVIYDYYHFFILPFLSISIFYAMEYMSRGIQFFIDDKGVKWKFLTFCAFMQFFVSLAVILSVTAVFESETLMEYKTLRLSAIILLGTTPFNISILIWVAIKLEIYRLMQNRYKEELHRIIETQGMMQEAIIGIDTKETQEKQVSNINENTTHTQDSQQQKAQDKEAQQEKKQEQGLT